MWRRRIKYFRRYLLYLLIKWLIWGIQKLPLSWAQGLGKGLGGLAYCFAVRDRRQALRNLEAAFGEQFSWEERKEIVFRMFQHFGEMGCEWICLPKLSRQEIEEMVVWGEDTEEKMLAIYQRYGRTILLTAHLGHWELAGAWLACRLPLGVVARRVYYPPLNELVVELRKSLKMRVFYSRDNPKNLIQALREGYNIALLPDQHLKRMKGIWIPFFGQEAFTITAPATLSLLTKAPLVPAYAIKIRRKYRIFLEDPISIPNHLPKKEQILYLTLAWSQVLERYIRAYPYQWAWNHRRWRKKTREKN